MNKKETEALATEYNRVRKERLALDQQSAKLKVREDSILDQLTAADVVSGIYGKVDLQVSTKNVPRCTDWPGFHAYILSSGNLDMLHKRLTDTAVMARVEAGEYVPGIVTDEKKTYRVTLA